MSGEQLTSKNLRTPNVNSFNKQKSSRVNINNLLYRVRAEKVREKRENYVFLGLVVGVLAVTGIIASF
tara:strand:- start:1531 stop:1734 length:204 start_codon:yes stop_codon:yes gene_type:complete